MRGPALAGLLLPLLGACSSHSAYESGNGGVGGAAGSGASGAPTAGAGGSAAGAGGANSGGSSTGGANSGGSNAGVGIERIASTTTLVSDGPDLVVDLPSSVLPDDLVLVTLYVDNGQDAGAELSDPLGFTMTSPLAAAGCGSSVVWYGQRVVQAGDPDTYVFSFTSQGIMGATAAFAIYRGVDPSSPFAAQQARGLEETNFALPNLGPLAADSVVVAIFTDDFNESGSWEPPPGMIEFIDSGSIGAFEAHLETASAAPLGDAVSSTNGCGTVYAAALAPL